MLLDDPDMYNYKKLGIEPYWMKQQREEEEERKQKENEKNNTSNNLSISLTNCASRDHG